MTKTLTEGKVQHFKWGVGHAIHHSNAKKFCIEKVAKRKIVVRRYFKHIIIKIF